MTPFMLVISKTGIENATGSKMLERYRVRYLPSELFFLLYVLFIFSHMLRHRHGVF